MRHAALQQHPFPSSSSSSPELYKLMHPVKLTISCHRTRPVESHSQVSWWRTGRATEFPKHSSHVRTSPAATRSGSALPLHAFVAIQHTLHVHMVPAPAAPCELGPPQQAQDEAAWLPGLAVAAGARLMSTRSSCHFVRHHPSSAAAKASAADAPAPLLLW